MSALTELDKMITKCKLEIDTSESLERLMKNKDFKKIFLDYYIKEQVLELVESKTSPDMTPKDLAIVEDQLTATSYFSRFLINIRTIGINGTQALANAEYEKDMCLREDNE